VPKKDVEFKTNPMKFMEGRTLKGTFYGHYRPRTDIPGVVEKYLNKVITKLDLIYISLRTKLKYSSLEIILLFN